ncbi:MAG TPA: Calx-beta domain-containing protein, partial [Vicinamibacteria bacterium]
KYNSRRRISIHHNVYTANGERNPQIKGDAQNIDFVSNVVYNNLPLLDPESGTNFSPYGTRLWNANSASDSPGNVTGNFRSNAWIDPHGELEIQTEPGASAAGIYLADNYCKPGPCPGSPASSPLAVPVVNSIIPTAPGLMRTQLLPTVGSPNRAALDQTRIDQVAAALPLLCTPAVARQVSIGNQSLSEGNSGAALMVFTAALSGPSTCPFTVGYVTGNGTATAGSDYDPATGVLIFPVGSTSQTVTVSIRGDRVFESDEDLVVNLAGPSGGTIADGQAVGTIVNDDATGFSVNDLSVVEPASGTTTASFTVTLSPVLGSVTSVAYATVNGTATAPADYAAKSGTLNFAAGASTQPVSIVVNADSLKEAVETFTVNLSTPTGGATVASPSGTGSVYDKGAFFTLPPCRLIDTRSAGLGAPALAASTTRNFNLAGGSCGVPATAKAVALNVTVTGATRAGNLRLFAAGAALPLASTINYAPNQTRANNLVVNVNASVQLGVRCDQASGTVHLIVDVAGYVL